MVFHSFKIPCWSTQKAAKTMKKKKKNVWRAHSALWAPKIPQGPLPIQRVVPKGSIPSFGGGPQDQSQPATLYIMCPHFNSYFARFQIHVSPFLVLSLVRGLDVAPSTLRSWWHNTFFEGFYASLTECSGATSFVPPSPDGRTLLPCGHHSAFVISLQTALLVVPCCLSHDISFFDLVSKLVATETVSVSTLLLYKHMCVVSAASWYLNLGHCWVECKTSRHPLTVTSLCTPDQWLILPACFSTDQAGPRHKAPSAPLNLPAS